MTRVLFVGDLAPSGFGSVTTDLGRAMLDLDLDVRFVSQNDLNTKLPEPFASRAVDLAFLEYQAGVQGVTGIRPDLLGGLIRGDSQALLVDGSPWGGWKPEACILLGDFAAARLLAGRFTDAFRMVPTFHYVPIEGIGLPPLLRGLWSLFRPVAMSTFGQDQIELVTGKRPPLAYHGVDAEVFRPVSMSEPLIVPESNHPEPTMVTLPSKNHCRTFFGLDPRHTIILRTDRVMPRKRYDSLLRAMEPVLASHPDARLVLHCSMFDQGGFLPDSISHLRGGESGMHPQIILTNKAGLPRSVLNALYNTADLYVSTSAEGFGLTIAEAMACGVPAVGLDYSAVPEVIGPGGMVVPVAQLYDNEYAHKWAWPDEEKYAETVSWMLDHPARARAFGQAGMKHVRESFQWAHTAQVFADLIAEATVGFPRQRYDPPALPPVSDYLQPVQEPVGASA